MTITAEPHVIGLKQALSTLAMVVAAVAVVGGGRAGSGAVVAAGAGRLILLAGGDRAGGLHHARARALRCGPGGDVLGHRRGRAGGLALVTAVLFAAVHAAPPAWPYLLTLGLGLAWLRWFHRNLWAPTVMHAVNNTLATLVVLAVT